MKLQPVVLVGTLSLTAVLSVGCDDGGETPTNRPADVTASSTSRGAVAERTGPPTGVVSDPVAGGVGEVVLTEDSVVSLSAIARRKCRLTAESLEGSRKLRWEIDKVDDLRFGCGGLALTGSTLVLPYVKETPGKGIEVGHTEHGVLGLNLDGSHRWHTAVANIDTVVGVNERFILATDSRSVLPGSTEDRLTAVLDAGDGRMLWQLSGLKPVGVDGDVVLATPFLDATPLDPTDKLMAFDAASGRERWSTDMVELGGVGFVGTGVVAVPVLQNSDDVIGLDTNIALLDITSGAVLYTEPDAAPYPTCVSDGKVAVVCQLSGGGDEGNLIFAFDLGTKQRSWSIPPAQTSEAGIRVRSMVDGRLFVSTKTQGALVDAATGKQVAHSLAATPTTVRGAYGVVYDQVITGDMQQTSFKIYRLTW